MYATLKPRNGTPYLFNPPYLTLCRRDGGGTKIFWLKIFFRLKSFWTHDFFGLTIFLDPKYFWPHNFFWPNITLFRRGRDINLTSIFKGFLALKEAKIWYVGYSKAKEWTPTPTPSLYPTRHNLPYALGKGGGQKLSLMTFQAEHFRLKSCSKYINGYW